MERRCSAINGGQGGIRQGQPDSPHSGTDRSGAASGRKEAQDAGGAGANV